jgi:hypothetical protein
MKKKFFVNGKYFKIGEEQGERVWEQKKFFFRQNSINQRTQNEKKIF